mmetsp:Transcript_47196/g.119462  ORF Transcript_47196/g.119462 Transcript_47196/m.119462 type:complete len:258 (-) Transcript_47196:870-1643(-)
MAAVLTSTLQCAAGKLWHKACRSSDWSAKILRILASGRPNRWRSRAKRPRVSWAPRESCRVKWRSGMDRMVSSTLPMTGERMSTRRSATTRSYSRAKLYLRTSSKIPGTPGSGRPQKCRCRGDPRKGCRPPRPADSSAAGPWLELRLQWEAFKVRSASGMARTASRASETAAGPTCTPRSATTRPWPWARPSSPTWWRTRGIQESGRPRTSGSTRRVLLRRWPPRLSRPSSRRRFLHTWAIFSLRPRRRICPEGPLQ